MNSITQDGRKVTMIYLNEFEKALIRDATREVRYKIVQELRKMGASDKFFNLFNNFLFLEVRYKAAYDSDPIVQIEYKNLLSTAKDVLEKIGVPIHPIDDLGYVACSESMFDSSKPTKQE